MKRTKQNIVAAGAMLACLLLASPLARAAQSTQTRNLPDFVVRELTHLAEAYRVLDITAKEVWPGWTNYRDFPFLLHYPNNLKVLIGHPNPPAPYEKMPGLKVEDKDVYVDFSEVNTAKCEYPLFAGGGPQQFGETKDGKPVQTVFMDFMPAEYIENAPAGYGVTKVPFCIECQILCYIHELFHCFQHGNIKMDMVGNLRFNPDAVYDLYSTIEGYALARAYEAGDRETAFSFIRDFLAARHIKRTATMPEEQQAQESSDNLTEGTAVYSEVRTIETLARGYKTGLDLSKDKYYHGFMNAPQLLDAHLRSLREVSEQPYDCGGKAYDFGCFQALLLQRYNPGWQSAFATKPSTLDKELTKMVGFDPKDAAAIAASEKRFREIYGSDKIKARVDEAISKRDSAYVDIMSRKGMAYIINFKDIQVYENQVLQTAPQYALGLYHLYYKGFPAVKADRFEISPISVPFLGDKLYYFKIVDTAPKAGAKPYTVTGKTTDGQTYENAVITTPLFTLKTALVRIEESKDRVKIVLLPILQK